MALLLSVLFFMDLLLQSNRCQQQEQVIKFTKEEGYKDGKYEKKVQQARVPYPIPIYLYFFMDSLGFPSLKSIVIPISLFVL